jgi:hypothetical protein
MPTDGWYTLIKDDPPLAAGAVGGIDRHIVFGGGYPIEIDARWADGAGRAR